MSNLGTSESSLIDPIYSKGRFWDKSSGHLDAEFKVKQLLMLLQQNPGFLPVPVRNIADVGCGKGITTHILSDLFSDSAEVVFHVDGYDVHPKVGELPVSKNVHFFAGDFCSIAREVYDLAVLFDVVEHVPDPIGFLKGIARFSDRVALIIPLDDVIFSWLRNLPRLKLTHPGHILVLDASAALNLLAFAGLRVVEYLFIPVFRAPSGRETRSQRLLNPVRELLYWISPVLLQKTFGGVSMMVLAVSPRALSEAGV